MKTNMLHIMVLSLVATLIAFGNPSIHKKMMKNLNLTETQKEQFEKISFDTQKKQIELKAKVETSKLEFRRLLSAEAIDKSAIEKKMNEIATNEVTLRMNHINAWTEKNKVLTSEQQKIWKKVLVHRPEKMNRQMKHNRRMRTPMPSEMERERQPDIDNRPRN